MKGSKKIKEAMQPLSNKETQELKALDNPDVKYYSVASAPFMSLFVGSGYQRLSNRKKRVVELRTRMSLNKLDIEPDKILQERYKIKEREEERFDGRFKGPSKERKEKQKVGKDKKGNTIHAKMEGFFK